jgi:WD40 repeat protein
MRIQLLPVTVFVLAFTGVSEVQSVRSAEPPTRVGKLPFDEDRDLRCLVFTADGKEIVSASLDNKGNVHINRWTIASGKCVHTFVKNPEPLPNRVVYPRVAVSLSSDARVVAFAGWRETVFVADATSGKMLLRVPTDSGNSALSSDGRLLIYLNRLPATVRQIVPRRHMPKVEPPKLIVVEVASGKPLGEIPALNETAFLSLHADCFSADGQAVTVCKFVEGPVAVWNLHQPFKSQVEVKLPDPWEPLASVLSPDGKTLAATGLIPVEPYESQMNSIFVWDAKTGKLIRQHRVEMGDLNFSPDSKKLAAVALEEIRVWNVETGKALMKVRRSPGCFRPLFAFSPDNKTLAIPQSDGFIHLWNTDTGAELTPP